MLLILTDICTILNFGFEPPSKFLARKHWQLFCFFVCVFRNKTIDSQFESSTHWVFSYISRNLKLGEKHEMMSKKPFQSWNEFPVLKWWPVLRWLCGTWVPIPPQRVHMTGCVTFTQTVSFLFPSGWCDAKKHKFFSKMLCFYEITIFF